MPGDVTFSGQSQKKIAAALPESRREIEQAA